MAPKSFAARRFATAGASVLALAGIAAAPAQALTPPQTVEYGYDLSGAATLKTLTKGNVPLSGSIDATLNLPGGEFTADLKLNPTTAKLTTLGFLPIVAKVAFVSTAPTTGTLQGGVLSSNSKVRIKLPQVTLFGVPLAGGASCQTKTASNIALKSTGAFFDPLAGGNLAGTFAISDLTGCGFLTGLVSPLTAGKGNAIALKLAPKPKPPVPPKPTPTPGPSTTPTPPPTPASTPMPTSTPTPTPTLPPSTPTPTPTPTPPLWTPGPPTPTPETPTPTPPQPTPWVTPTPTPVAPTPEPPTPTPTPETPNGPRDVNYQCTHPLVGNMPLRLFTFSPWPIVVGEPTDWRHLQVFAEPPRDQDGRLPLGAEAFDGTVSALTRFEAAGFSLDVPVVIPLRSDPSFGGPRLLWGSSNNPTKPTFPEPGTATFSVEALAVSLTARRADGTAIIVPSIGEDRDGDPETFDVDCAPVAGDEDEVLWVEEIYAVPPTPLATQ